MRNEELELELARKWNTKLEQKGGQPSTYSVIWSNVKPKEFKQICTLTRKQIQAKAHYITLLIVTINTIFGSGNETKTAFIDNRKDLLGPRLDKIFPAELILFNSFSSSFSHSSRSSSAAQQKYKSVLQLLKKIETYREQ